MTAMLHGPLQRKLSAIIELTKEEIACIEVLQSESRSFERHCDVYTEGDQIERSLILRDGWAMRYKTLSDGRRQILSFVLPGDIVGLYASLIPTADHSLASLTPVKAWLFEPQQVIEVFGKCARLGAAIAWTARRDHAMLAEQVVRIGRRSAYERTGHLFLELLNRLQLVGLAGKSSYELPLTQDVLADALGLSMVHVNRTLRRLRQNGLIHVVDKRLVIQDIGRLEKAAEFSPTYMETDPWPDATVTELQT